MPSFAEGELPSRSSEEAVKRGVFIRKIFPEPVIFDWSGHEVRVKESWLERNPGGHHDLLILKLLVDESPTRELVIRKDNDRYIDFREEGRVKSTALIGTSISYPLRNYVKYRKGQGLGELVHFFEIKDPIPRKISLRVVTTDHTENLIDRTDVVLKFDELNGN